MAVVDPRNLVEITKYRNILNDKDAVSSVIAAIGEQSAEQLANSLTVSVNVSLRSGSSSVSKPAFNAHMAGYIKANLASMLPSVGTYMDGLVAEAKAKAEAEAGSLGMTSTPVTLVPPAILNDDTAEATIGGEFSLDIVADNTSGTGITSCVYSATGLAAWMTLDADTGAITGEVPSDATAGDSLTLTLKVTTNAGEDTKAVTVTYAAASAEPEE